MRREILHRQYSWTCRKDIFMSWCWETKLSYCVWAWLALAHCCSLHKNRSGRGRGPGTLYVIMEAPPYILPGRLVIWNEHRVISLSLQCWCGSLAKRRAKMKLLLKVLGPPLAVLWLIFKGPPFTIPALLVIFGVYLATNQRYKWLYILYKTLPRDLKWVSVPKQDSGFKKPLN